MNQHFIFSNSIFKNPLTSIETSILKRHKIFREHLNINPIYVCTEFDLAQKNYIKQLKKQKMIPENFKLVNLFELFLSDCDVYRKPASEQRESTAFNNGKKRLSRLYNPDTKNLAFVSFYDENEKIYRIDKYDIEGYLFGSFFITPQNTYQTTHFYRRDGSLAISIQHDEKMHTKTIKHIIVFDKRGVPASSFISNEELHLYLFRHYLKSFSHNDQVNIILDREIDLYSSLTATETAAKIKCIVLLHSNHIPNKVTNEIHTTTPNVIFELAQNDGIIVLTPQQAEDIKNEYGDYNNVHYIPHPIDQQEHSPYSERIKNRVIAIGRLSPEKQHNKMLRIFKKVLNKIPDAQLDIFGIGPQKEEISKQIRTLNLQNNVHLKGFTHNIEKEYRTAQCSILTSVFEGQPLVILESLSFGCPVVSNDIKYGPADMIEDGKNGFLVPKEDDTLFAERIIDILQNQKLAEQLSIQAYSSIERFSEKNIAPFWEKWVKAITS